MRFTWFDGLLLALILGALIAWVEFKVYDQGYQDGARYQLEYDLDRFEGSQE